MTWNAVHRRGEVLRDVVDEANLRRDGALPVDVPGVAETFADDLALVAALQLRWHTRLAGRIERALGEQPSDLESAVLTAWRRTAADIPGVRMILDAYAAEPTSTEMATALGTACRKEWVLLAAMAGRASAADSGAVDVGRRLEEQARMAYDPTAQPRRHRPDKTTQAHDGTSPFATIVDRIKAHLAA
jgi:hypothetical protein